MEQNDKNFERLATFPAQNPNPVMEMSYEGEIIYLNPAASKYFTKLQTEGINHSVFDNIREQLKNNKIEKITDNSYELSWHGYIFEEKIINMPEYGVIRIFLTDITKIKETEKNLARLATFPEHNPNPVMEIQLTGDITYINPAVKERFPNIYEENTEHPIVEHAWKNKERLIKGEIIFNELKLNERYYEQKIVYLSEVEIIRIYSYDVTQRKESEDIIKEKNKEILDSIHYAQKIQSALLPSEEVFGELLPSSFIVFMPRDIVSGDYYWVSERDNYIFYATADCTGHGVPGGFMSMLGTALLNEIIDERRIEEPAQVLNLMRDKIMQALKQAGDSESKDGMDMVLIRINKVTLEMQYAAANNSFYIVKSNETQDMRQEVSHLTSYVSPLIEMHCDKMPVGVYHSKIKPFQTHTYQLKKGDIIYTYTDGYADQFGGEKNKKFTYKRLRDLLIKNAALPLEEQKRILVEEFNKWKGTLEQIDDVCLLGVKI